MQLKILNLMMVEKGKFNGKGTCLKGTLPKNIQQ